jgi:hypothetical protein
MMKEYEHTITTHDREEILSKAASPETPPSVVYCDAEGACFFDDAPNPYVRAVIELLDGIGRDGWELVQVIPREQDLICFWRRESGEGEGP